MRKINCILLILLFVPTISCEQAGKKDFTEINLRLQWIPQCQFAGYIVASIKGFYEERGLKVNLLPAGPDLKPHMTVASRTDDIGIGVSNQIIGARSNEVPLVVIAQIFQDSANRYILKSENRIKDLRELKGKKVGLWLGGDEVEFMAMLKTASMDLSDVIVVPQEFSVILFLEDQYVLSQVTVYNELNLIRDQGYEGEKLQVLSPKNYNSAIVGDMIFCRERYLEQNKLIVTKFLEASILGWKYCIEHPDEAVDIVVKYNPELKVEDQKKQLKAVLQLIQSGNALEYGIGYPDEKDYANAERILFESGQIDKRVNPKDCFDISAWAMISPDIVKLQ